MRGLDVRGKRGAIIHLEFSNTSRACWLTEFFHRGKKAGNVLHGVLIWFQIININHKKGSRWHWPNPSMA